MTPTQTKPAATPLPDRQMMILAKLVELIDAGATDSSSEVAALYAEFNQLDEDTAENIDPRIVTRWALDNYDPMHLREMNHASVNSALRESLAECVAALEIMSRQAANLADAVRLTQPIDTAFRHAVDKANAVAAKARSLTT